MPEDRLPQPLTSFLGRADEVAAIARAMREHRLVTLTGPGGVGKTRLAIEAARAAVPAFGEAAWFVDLAPVRDGEALPGTILARLGSAEPQGAPLQSLLGLVGGRELLIVLDNCEHLIEAAAATVDQLLRTCAGTAVLATSREPLGVQGELVWRVPPLALPARAESLPLSDVQQVPVVQLFVERAKLASPSFSLTAENVASVIEICSAVDRLPLAIELAAARVRTLPVAQVSERLVERLPLLAGGARTAPERQRTMEGAIRWSSDLLTDEEKSLFRRLAVFAGGWTLEAAEGVCAFGDLEERRILPLLERLVDQSLVVASTDEGGRFHFLEVILEFARDQLLASGEVEIACSRHCRWFASLAVRAEPELPGRAGLFWMERMAPEQDNFAAALDWALDHPADVEAGLDLGGNLRWFWTHAVNSTWALTRIQRVLDAIPSGAPVPARVRLLIAASWFAEMGSAKARGFADEAVALARELDDDGLLGLALECISRGALGNLAVAGMRVAAAEGVQLARRAGDPSLETRLLIHLAIADEEEGDVDAATPHLEHALDLARGHDLRELALVLNCMGDHARLREAFGEAEGFYRRALEASLARRSARLVLMATLNLGVALVLAGRRDAAGVLRQALDMGLQLGDHAFVAEGLRGIATIEAARGEAGFAARLLGAADTYYGGAPTQAPDRPLRDLAFGPARRRLAAGFDREYEAGKRWGLAAAAREVLAARPPPTVAAAPTRPAGLTPREVEILCLMAEGASNQGIADRLVLSRRTVDTHIAHVYSKIDASNRVEAVRFALDHGLAPSVVA